jgi:hypothetical protein
MTYNLGLLPIGSLKTTGFRGPTGRVSDYIAYKKTKIINCKIEKPFNCSSEYNKISGLSQNEYLLSKKGFFIK